MQERWGEQQRGLNRGPGATEPLWRLQGGWAAPGPSSPGARGSLRGQHGLEPLPRLSGGWEGLRPQTWG